MWDFLSRPLENTAPALRKVIDAVKKLLTQLVQGDEATIADLRTYLVSALSVDETTAQTLLWEAPRSLLLEAVPTLVRRLFRQWQLAFPTAPASRDLQSDYHPLPDFVPRSLFSELSLPEVRIIVPPATVNHEERIETMPILQALNQFVPGRVTRRFAHERGALSHWVAVDPAIPEQDRRISDYAEEHEFVGTFTGRYNDQIDEQPLLVFRPWSVRLVKAARADALPSSNARLSWRTDIIANGDPLSVPVPSRSQWHPYVRSVDFHLHRFRSSVSVRRFAPTAHANVRKLRDDYPVTLHFRSDDDRPAALGFELEVDGFRLDLSLPPASEILTRGNLPTALGYTSKLAYLHDTFRSDPKLPVDLNGFQRDWLFQILMSALLADAAATDRAMDVVAVELLDESRIEDTFRGVMVELFGAIPQGLQDDDNAEDANETDNQPADSATRASPPPSTHSSPARLQQTLANQLAHPVVRDRLRALANEFAAPDATAFGAWLRRLVVETLGEAVLQACIASAPRHSTVDNLLVDIRDDAATGIATVWISEATLGGAGVLQAFAERFASEPRLFFTAVEAALMPTDLELVDGGLREILALASTDAHVTDHLARLRATDSHSERANIWQSLSHLLTSRGGIDLSHALSVSLNKRLLRSASGPELDRLLLDLQRHWDDLELKYGLSIGLREFAYACTKNAELSARIRTFLGATLPTATAGHVTVLAAVTSLLWPREGELRQKTLQSYNPFRLSRTTDPAVVRHLLLTRSVTTIELSVPNWREQLRSALEARGECRLAANANQTAALRQALIQFVATPVDVGFLQFFPVVERVERSLGLILASLTLREQV